MEVLALRIVSNLLDNAIAAITAPKPTDQVTLRLALTATGTLTIVVTDTGSGISPAVRTQMFTQGFSTKGPQRGYGMNLIMAL
ncbi:ATP-binding protein [Levilactobacillus brevis]|nr:ATP-binding protein [Levilactobacillus brevis]